MQNHHRSHGILIVMVGIVITTLGILYALILSSHGPARYGMVITGVGIGVFGLVLAVRAGRWQREHGAIARARRGARDLPTAQVLRGRPRRGR